MGLATVFKLSIYSLTGFVGLILGAAEYGFIPFISLPVTVFAYWWCETGNDAAGNRRGLSESLALVFGFLSLVASSFEFFSESHEGRLLSGIHLVVYLTWVVLLQQKSNYRYWLLMTLGMMHVAVGAVLTNATWYGLSMIVYLFGAIWTLSVFSLYRVAQEFAAIEPDSVKETAPQGVGAAPDLRAEVFNDICLENNASWISFRLVSGVALTSLAGLLVGGAFFALIPRVWVGSALGISDDALPSSLRRATGQAQEVRLGDFGQILVSNDPVLKLKIFDLNTEKQIGAQSYAESLGMREPLFRGAVLTEYAAGNWRPLPPAGMTTTGMARYYQSETPDSIQAYYRQEFHLERIGTNVLYSLGRPLAMRDREGRKRIASTETSSQLVVRYGNFESLPGAVDYTVISGNGTQADRTLPGVTNQFPNLESNYVKRCLHVSIKLTRLIELATRIRDDAAKRAGRPTTPLETARAIESYLRDSGDFAYSLETPVVDPDLDPVEDFLFNRRTGHCQYFATALALMLRAVNIPARVVTGFKGGIEHPDGTLDVEKRFAHAWVEARLESRRWVSFDATPEDGRAESVTEIGSKRNMFSLLSSKLAGIWESNILDVSLERQEIMIYEPLREWFNSFVEFQKTLVKSPAAAVAMLFSNLFDLRTWLSVPGIMLLFVISGTIWLLRRRVAWFRGLFARHATTSAEETRRIEFYERFVTLMKSSGRIRQPGQTQLEFASEVAQELAMQLDDRAIDSEIQGIAGLFYRVRFGEGELTGAESAKLGELLSRLEQDLDPKNQRRQQAADQFRNHSSQLAGIAATEGTEAHRGEQND